MFTYVEREREITLCLPLSLSIYKYIHTYTHLIQLFLASRTSIRPPPAPSGIRRLQD